MSFSLTQDSSKGAHSSQPICRALAHSNVFRGSIDFQNTFEILSLSHNSNQIERTFSWALKKPKSRTNSFGARLFFCRTLTLYWASFTGRPLWLLWRPFRAFRWRGASNWNRLLMRSPVLACFGQNKFELPARACHLTESGSSAKKI